MSHVSLIFGHVLLTFAFRPVYLQKCDRQSRNLLNLQMLIVRSVHIRIDPFQ